MTKTSLQSFALSAIMREYPDDVRLRTNGARMTWRNLRDEICVFKIAALVAVLLLTLRRVRGEHDLDHRRPARVPS